MKYGFGGLHRIYYGNFISVGYDAMYNVLYKEVEMGNRERKP
jgi:hypothetical protein